MRMHEKLKSHDIQCIQYNHQQHPTFIYRYNGRTYQNVLVTTQSFVNDSIHYHELFVTHRIILHKSFHNH